MLINTPITLIVKSRKFFIKILKLAVLVYWLYLEPLALSTKDNKFPVLSMHSRKKVCVQTLRWVLRANNPEFHFIIPDWNYST